jgi:transcription antitermination protein NusB
MKNYTRKDERVKTMQAFYQVFLFLEQKTEFDATEVINSIYNVKSIDDVPKFSKAIYAFGLEHIEELEKVIEEHLVGWTFSRLDDVAKAILVSGCAEGLYVKLAPRKVVINEWVNIAKDFLKVNDHKFINAVLDKVIVDYEFTPKN